MTSTAATNDPTDNVPLQTYQKVGRILGPAVFGLMLFTDQYQGVMSHDAWRVAAVGLWMAIWWATEAIPVPVTAFIPILIFDPLGIASIRDASAPFTNHRLRPRP